MSVGFKPLLTLALLLSSVAAFRLKVELGEYVSGSWVLADPCWTTISISGVAFVLTVWNQGQQDGSVEMRFILTVPSRTEI
jgi:hypothetical protein